MRSYRNRTEHLHVDETIMRSYRNQTERNIGPMHVDETIMRSCIKDISRFLMSTVKKSTNHNGMQYSPKLPLPPTFCTSATISTSATSEGLYLNQNETQISARKTAAAPIGTPTLTAAGQQAALPLSVAEQSSVYNGEPDISLRLDVEPLSREHRDTRTEKDTEPTIYRSQQCDTRSGPRAGKIKGVVHLVTLSRQVASDFW